MASLSDPGNIANFIEDLKIDIKSLLLSSKDGLTEGELKSEYLELTGNDLLRKIYNTGYKNIHDFMKSSPDSFNIRKHRDGIIWVYHAVSDENTLDLLCLIKGQKDSNKSKREEKRSREAYRRKHMQQQYDSRPRFRSQNGGGGYGQNRVRFDYSNSNNQRNQFFRNRSPSLTNSDKYQTNGFSKSNNNNTNNYNYNNSNNNFTSNNNNGFSNKNGFNNFNDTNNNNSNNNSNNNNNNNVLANSINNFSTDYNINKRGYPIIIKNRVESVLLEAADYKLEINQFEKEYEKKHGALLDYKAYGYQTIMELIESMKDIVSLDLSYNHSSFFDKYIVRLLRPKSLSDSDYCSNTSLNKITDLNNNFNLNDVHDLNDNIVVKCKKIKLNDQNVNLISLNGAIIVHWTQIADLFSMKQFIFKKLIDISPIDAFTKTFKYNDNNRFLFDLIEDRLEINLEETNELNEIYFIYYDKLLDLCDIIFSNDLKKSIYLKSLIKQTSHENKICL